MRGPVNQDHIVFAMFIRAGTRDKVQGAGLGLGSSLLFQNLESSFSPNLGEGWKR